MPNNSRFMTILSFVVVLFSGWSSAQVPQLINYQALLVDPASGNPVPDGTHSIVFSIYNSATGGSAVWAETQIVQTQDGLYTVLLGSNTPLTATVLSGSQKYLGIKVGSDPEQTPRRRIVSTAYAIMSEESNKLDGMDASDFAAVTHDHDSRYYLQSLLNTSDGSPPNQGSNLVSWDNLTNMPSGFVDGVDDIGSGGVGNSLDQAYDQGGPGQGRTIIADAGPVNIDGPDGLAVNSKVGIGTVNPNPTAKLHVVGGDVHLQGGGYNFVPAGGGDPDIAFYRGGADPNSIATIRRFADEHTILQILTPPQTFFNAYEATLALVRGDEPNVELVDLYNNGYPSETQYGVRMQKRGTGQYRDFVFDYSDGVTNTEVMRLTPSGNVGIGNIANAKLHVDGDLSLPSTRLYFAGAFNPTYYMQYFTSSGLKFVVNNNEALFLDVNGNVGMGTTSPGFTLHVNGSAGKPGGGSWSVASDKRLKDIGGNFSRGLNDIARINPVYYRYKAGNPLELPTDLQYVGLIAQEVQEVIPEAIEADKGEYLFINSEPITWAMLNAIKELKTKNERTVSEIEILRDANLDLKAELQHVNAEMAALISRVARLESTMERIASSNPLESSIRQTRQ